MVTLHGPSRRPLSFNWRLHDDEWTQDWSTYQPMTFPLPRPDYAPAEADALIAAEVKRARRDGAPVPAHVTDTTLPGLYFNPGTVVIRGTETGSQTTPGAGKASRSDCSFLYVNKK